MNNLSASDTRVSAETPQYILNYNIFYKSECVLFRYWDELYFYAWRTLLCYQLSFWIGQIALLTMDIFSHMGGMRGSTYKENTMKCRFIKLKYIYKN